MAANFFLRLHGERIDVCQVEIKIIQRKLESKVEHFYELGGKNFYVKSTIRLR